MHIFSVLFVSAIILEFATCLLCPPLNIPKNVVTNCYRLHYSNRISCNGTFPLNSVAEFQCKPFYKPIHEGINFKRIICLPNGDWSGEVLRCKAECGNAFPAAAVPLVLRGWNVSRPSWPWHISLFALEDNKWELTCGGTLITERVAVTAAHCVWKQVPNRLKIAAAKYTRDYDDDDPQTQIRKVERVYVHPLYEDIEGNYASDIALLVFQEAVSFCLFVSPACLNWDFHDFMHDGGSDERGLLIGTSVGMGITEQDKPSNFLQATTLLVVGAEDCKKSQDSKFRKFVTLTVFCAGWLNGSAVCNGDSGGGIVFPNHEYGQQKWIFEGIVSVSPRRQENFMCDYTKLTLFTKVGMYAYWIKNILLHLDKEETIFL